MSVKNLDRHNRWRNKTVAFRVSPDEDREIETAVRLSGLTKQDYITRRLLCRDVVVQGNPRVYKALRNELAAVLEELERIEAGNGVDGELLDTIRLIAAIMDGMREDFLLLFLLCCHVTNLLSFFTWMDDSFRDRRAIPAGVAPAALWPSRADAPPGECR